MVLTLLEGVCYGFSWLWLSRCSYTAHRWIVKQVKLKKSTSHLPQLFFAFIQSSLYQERIQPTYEEIHLTSHFLLPKNRERFREYQLILRR
jgi:hypothetical protein